MGRRPGAFPLPAGPVSGGGGAGASLSFRCCFLRFCSFAPFLFRLRSPSSCGRCAGAAGSPRHCSVFRLRRKSKRSECVVSEVSPGRVVLRACTLFYGLNGLIFSAIGDTFPRFAGKNAGLRAVDPWDVVRDPWGVATDPRPVSTEASHRGSARGLVLERAFGAFCTKRVLPSAAG